MRRPRDQCTASRPSKLDPFKGDIAEWLEKDPSVTRRRHRAEAPRPLGYQGGHSILREYVRKARPHLAPKRAFVRMEPLAGERFEVDWGHFGALTYSGDMRKLYAFALVDAHSRMLYVEFTHSQSFATFARCHIHAFTALGGVAREIAYDNLATAVAEHDGRLVRFLPRFLGFAREYGFFPHACNPASGWEKGKIERAIGYLRQNFWPLREFTDLHDVNRQVRQWLAEVANQRLHRETRERPLERFKPEALRPLPIIPYDYRDSTEALVHKDLRLRVRRQPLLRSPPLCRPPAHHQSRLQFRHHLRSRGRGRQLCAFVAARPDLRRRPLRENPGRRTARGPTLAGAAAIARFARWAVFAIRSWKLISATWPTRIVRWAVRSQELLELIRQYGPEDVAGAIEKAAAARAFGADYIANILRQQRSPRRPQPPLRLRDPLLNELATDPISLLEYDAFILESGKESDDSPRTETAATESESDEPPDRGDDR